MGRKPGEPRILDPKWDPARRRWRVTSINYNSEGKRQETRADFETEGEANEAVAEAREELRRPEVTTVEEALNQYLQGKAEIVKAVSVKLYRRALTSILEPVFDRPVVRLASRGQELYDKVRARPGMARGREGKPRAVATHHTALFAVKEFGGWLVKKKLLKANPWTDVAPVGKAKRGAESKPQPTDDEVQLFLDTARPYAEAGREGAVLACIYFLTGARASEPLSSRVRDLDAGGTKLWMQRKGDVRDWVHVPAFLQAPLRALTADKTPLAFLFNLRSRDSGYRWVRKICDEAGIPRCLWISMTTPP